MNEGRTQCTAYFDDMAWPLATDDAIGETEYRLRYGGLTREDQLIAASVLSAYTQMVYDPERKRRRVIRKLRELGKLPPKTRIS